MFEVSKVYPEAFSSGVYAKEKEVLGLKVFVDDEPLRSSLFTDSGNGVIPVSDFQTAVSGLLC